MCKTLPFYTSNSEGDVREKIAPDLRCGCLLGVGVLGPCWDYCLFLGGAQLKMEARHWALADDWFLHGRCLGHHLSIVSLNVGGAHFPWIGVVCVYLK